MSHFSYKQDTIAAIATPPGDGGVAIIRISGKDAVKIASKIFSGPVSTFISHTAHYGKIYNSKKEVIDDVLLLVMVQGKSYTGEETVEIFCHGGRLITRAVLEVVLEAGARAALPGEFTLRAFLNGKMDLAQAEAVQNLICATNYKALQIAEQQLRGSLSQKITTFQIALTRIASILEAWIDFPEEGLEFASLEELLEDLEKCAEEMQKLLDTFHDGRILYDGLSLCLIGSPNVGKSSLMNALLDKDRTIVSAVAGTTRDVIEDFLVKSGMHFKLSDTAGIRETNESIEQEGIKRSQTAMQESDLILLVLDSHKGLTEEDEHILKNVNPEKTLLIWNKIDLLPSKISKVELPHCVYVSAKQKTGLEEVWKHIESIIWKHGSPNKEEVMITNVRHYEALNEAIKAIHKVQIGLKEKHSPELLSFDMRHSLHELSKIIGRDVTEDVLNEIFARFCIGK